MDKRRVRVMKNLTNVHSTALTVLQLPGCPKAFVAKKIPVDTGCSNPEGLV